MALSKKGYDVSCITRRKEHINFAIEKKYIKRGESFNSPELIGNADLIIVAINDASKKAEELKNSYAKAFIPNQFENKANAKAHFETTGPEIWNDTDGKVDIFVAGVGTGGTITGTGKYLKSKNPKIKIVAVEPKDSPVLSCGKTGQHKIQGIGAGFIPKVLDTEIYEEIITASTENAYETLKTLGKAEGILVGISSGAALYAAIEQALKEENKGKNIVVLLPDTGDRYLSVL